MNEPTVKVCLNCRFWYFKGNNMLCRRRAPTRDLMLRACWPQTLPMQYCGEHEPEQRPEVERRKSLLRPQAEIRSLEDIDISD